MSKLHNISPNAVQSIQDGLASLSEALLNINAVAGDTSSRLILEGDRLVVQGTITTFSGKVGIGVDQVSNGVDLETVNAVKFQGKRFEVGNGIPTIGVYNKGDIVWNDSPVPNGNVGWICIRTGNPGEWRSFGMIGG
mgnify:CR=1 FL=1